MLSEESFSFEAYVANFYENKINQYQDYVPSQLAEIIAFDFVHFCSYFVFLNDGSFFSSGFYAILQILEKTLLISDDYKFVLKKLIFHFFNNQDLIAIFEKKKVIHTELEAVFNTSLQNPINYKNSNNDLNRAIFSALFFELRQHKKIGNCFAISTLNFLLLRRPCKIADFLVKIFSTNSVEFKNFTISVSSLWSNRELKHDLFERSVCPDSYQLQPFMQRSLKAHDIFLKGVYPKEKCSLNDFFKLIVKTEKLSNAIGYSLMSYFEAHFYNPIQCLLLKIFEIASINYDQNITLCNKRVIQTRNPKIYFFTFLLKELEYALSVRDIYCDSNRYLLLQFIFHLNKCFYLERIDLLNIKTNSDLLELNDASLTSIENINYSIKSLLKSHFRFVFFTENESIVINKFEIFFKKVLETLDSLTDDNIDDNHVISPAKKFRKFIESEEFHVIIYQSIEATNKYFHVKVNWKDHCYINKPYLVSIGGWNRYIFDFLKIKYKKETVSGKSCKECLVNLLNYFKNKGNKTLLVESENHSFIFIPRFLDYFLSITSDVEEALNKWVIAPAKELLNVLILTKETKEFLKGIINDERIADLEKQGFFDRTYNLRDYRDAVISFLTSDQKKVFREHFNYELYNVDLNVFLKKHLSFCVEEISKVAELSCLPNTEDVKKFIIDHYKEGWYCPEELSLFLQNALHKLYKLNIEKEIIEPILYIILKKPFLFKIADLNYQTLDFLMEKRAYSFLHIKYDFFEEEFVFMRNIDDKDYYYSPEDQPSFYQLSFLKLTGI